jgi:hypothetical protein
VPPPARACSPRAGGGSWAFGGQGTRRSWRAEQRDALAPREREERNAPEPRPAPSPVRTAEASRALRPAQGAARELAGGAPWDAACLVAGGRSSERAPLARASGGLGGPAGPPRWRARDWRAAPPRAPRAPLPLGPVDSSDGGAALAVAPRTPSPWGPVLVGRAASFLSWRGRCRLEVQLRPWAGVHSQRKTKSASGPLLEPPAHPGKSSRPVPREGVLTSHCESLEAPLYREARP